MATSSADNNEHRCEELERCGSEVDDPEEKPSTYEVLPAERVLSFFVQEFKPPSCRPAREAAGITMETPTTVRWGTQTRSREALGITAKTKTTKQALVKAGDGAGGAKMN